MPIISDEKLNTLTAAGKAKLDRPGRLLTSAPPAKVKPEDPSLPVLRSIQDSLRQVATKDDMETRAVLRSIEALLVKLIELTRQPIASPVVSREKTNWHFQITRDRNGRLAEIEAVPK